ncbi:MAG: tetratricopeptide repeat protein, partial [Myxococcales bacterium]|nr:tetratricopeptide repeat protein [Myxococcales bacterium]
RAWVLVQAATMFRHEGDPAGAEAGFDRALAEVPGYAPALVGKGRLALARGDARAAVQLLARAYEASPLAETAWLLGDALAMGGDEAGARDAYAHVERSGRQGDRRTLALFWATKGLHPAEALALADEESRARADTYTEDAHAWALYRAGRLAAARASSDRALAHGTRDATLWFHAGAIRLAQGERASGRALVERALALEPGFDVSGAAEARTLLR